MGACCLAAFITAGCGGSRDETTATESETLRDDANATADQLETAIETTKPAVEQAVSDASETAQKAVSEASTKAQELIDKARALVNQENFSEAMNILNQLANVELTPEQQRLVDDLKATVQKALESKAAAEGTKAIGNMLGTQPEQAAPTTP